MMGVLVTVTMVDPAPAPMKLTPFELFKAMPLPHEYEPAANVIVAPSDALFTAVCTCATVDPALQVQLVPEPEQAARASRAPATLNAATAATTNVNRFINSSIYA
jgi:hypothetical protein